VAIQIGRDRGKVDLTLRGSRLVERLKVNVHEYFTLFYRSRMNGEDFDEQFALIAHEMGSYYENLADDELDGIHKFFSFFAEVRNMHLEWVKRTEKHHLGLKDKDSATIQ